MTEVTYCANHPDRETSLRCNRCGKLICSQCAVHTPTGYRCTECVRSHQKTFDTATWFDYVTGSVVALVLSYLGALLSTRIGFFTILLAPAAGAVIAEAVRLVVGRRRSKRLFQLVTVAVVLGPLPQLLSTVMLLLLGGGSIGFLFALLWPGLYLVIVTSTVYYRLMGI